MLEYISSVLSSIIVGVILFQSLLIAPSVNKIISKQEASIFLRFIWPNFFLLIAFLSFINLLLFFILKQDDKFIFYLSLVSCLLMVFCYCVTPIINSAKDNSNQRLWSFLHFVTIIFTLKSLISNIIIITL
tara:strand:- start:27273 stop:27665 length:393 start_codon:yes stop_codon:yes gene_type:complete